MKNNISLKNMCRLYLGISLNKNKNLTCSDWARRPLNYN